MMAPRGAFVADGAEGNRGAQKKHFPRLAAIVGFIRVPSRVFAAATAGRPFAEGREAYRQRTAWVWRGEVGQALEEVRQRLAESAEGSKGAESVGKSPGHLEGQEGRMNYAGRREAGPPIMSGVTGPAAEQTGRRVRGTEKFWSGRGVEAVTQPRAGCLSDDEPMARFRQGRAGRLTGQRACKRRSA
jgi:hypothetical protein